MRFATRTAAECSEEWHQIGDWASFEPPRPCRVPLLLDHGYDESRPASQWSTFDYFEAASFRGGDLLSTEARSGDIATPLIWRCALGHIFAGSPRLILPEGHWCPDCVRNPDRYGVQAEENPFLAQIELASAQRVASAVRRHER